MDQQTEPALPFPVVGIGASAGGLEAATEMLSAVEPTSSAAYVLVQHLAPDHESLMAELIDRKTQIDVLQAEDGQAMVPGRAYVIPPGHSLSMEGGRLCLSTFGEPRGMRRPIDTFFQSLAEEQGSECAAVVLSGTGADGSQGLRAVKGAGGICLAQVPEEAAYDGMPSAAIGTGLMDFVESARDLPAAIERYFRRRKSRSLESDASDVADVVDDLCASLADAVGHDFSGYKRGTLIRRIQRRMQVIEAASGADYLARIRSDEVECEALLRDLLINVTAFFRDRPLFDTLLEEALLPILKGSSSADEIRIWVPGCSSGEEAYTIAMLIDSTLDEVRGRPTVTIFATDIDEQMVRRARQAEYPSSAIADIPEAFRERYTIGKDGQFVISPRLRDMVRFSVHSLIKDPPFSRLSLISCRNLLIYMGDSLQQDLMPIFHYSLREGGYLFLGPSESLSRRTDLFSPVHTKARLYQRRPGDVRYPFQLPGRVKVRAKQRSLEAVTTRSDTESSVQESHTTAILERYAPASVVVDREDDLVSSTGDIGKYFLFYPGDRQSQVSKLARPGLREHLTTALRQVRAEGRRAVLKDLTVRSADGTQTVSVAVEPLGESRCLVVFLQSEPFRAGVDDDVVQPVDDEDRLVLLEDELRLTRYRLRGAVEELESANEELKSSNEEMMSMNEELQSANEELTTVNDELNSKVDELASINAEFADFLRCARVAILFVDEALRVRTFTDEARVLFSSLQLDRTRTLSDVSAMIDDPDLVVDVRQCLQGGGEVERPVRLRDDPEHRLFLLRIQAFDSDVGRVGAIVTLSDVTRVTHLEADLDAKSSRLAMALEAGRMGVWEYFPDTGAVTSNDTLAELFDLEPPGPGTMAGFVEHIVEADRERVTGALHEAVAQGSDIDLEFRIADDDDQERTLKSTGHVLSTTGGARTLVGITRDITLERRSQDAQKLMTREINHRVKNLFAVIASLVSLEARSAADVSALAKTLRDRIFTLARAHDVSRRQEGVTSVELGALLREVMAPYAVQVDLQGSDVRVRADTVTSIGLVFHELATNSVKYGALGADEGRVSITWATTGQGGRITWVEEGGPPARLENVDGFGSRLLEMSARQLGGSVEREFQPQGMRLVLHMGHEAIDG